MATSFHPLDIRKRLGKDQWRIPRQLPNVDQSGPGDGWLFDMDTPAQTGRIILTAGPGPDNLDREDWWHASFSYPDHLPTYDELTLMHFAIWPQGWAYQVFAPPSPPHQHPPLRTPPLGQTRRQAAPPQLRNPRNHLMTTPQIPPLNLDGTADDPEPYDVAQAVREVERYLTQPLARLHLEFRNAADAISRRNARLHARQLSLAGRQAAGEAILTLGASLGTMRRAGDQSAELMYLITILTGYHLLPDKLRGPETTNG